MLVDSHGWTSLEGKVESKIDGSNIQSVGGEISLASIRVRLVIGRKLQKATPQSREQLFGPETLPGWSFPKTQ